MNYTTQHNPWAQRDTPVPQHNTKPARHKSHCYRQVSECHFFNQYTKSKVNFIGMTKFSHLTFTTIFPSSA